MKICLKALMFIIIGFSPALAIEKKSETKELKSSDQVVSNKLQVINQVLFYESAQSWTLRDFELYQKLMNVVLQKSKLSTFSENNYDDFILSRLSAREAELFEVKAEPLKLTENHKKFLTQYSNTEILQELSEISSASSLIEIKETQLKQKLRFRTWYDLLKRKYQVKLKVADIK